jgi:drug/metabolite transporter (DMT)-like permease
MIRRRLPRRVAGAVLVVTGGLFMWLAPESLAGVLLLVAGIALEAVGLRLERPAGDSKEDPHALER